MNAAFNIYIRWFNQMQVLSHKRISGMEETA